MMGACFGNALQLLQTGQWGAWKGLPAGISLSALEEAFGGSTVLDSIVFLGTARTRCSRSSFNDIPAIVWHMADTPLLIELDLLSMPQSSPRLDGPDVYRLDARLGEASIAGGEAVMSARGLALIVTSNQTVVACRVFAPMSVDRYVKTVRPTVAPARPLPEVPGGSP
jgi:hypothetical protein